MNIIALNTVTKYVADAIASGSGETDIAREAEKLSATSGVEFHPLVCDFVVAGFQSGDKVRHCDHVSRATREAADAALKAALAA